MKTDTCEQLEREVIDKPLVVCGTGHRPNKLGGYSTKAFENLVGIATDWIVENEPTEIISGGALGWDQALAVAAIRNKIFLTMALPFESQACKWPQASQDLFDRILKKADCIEIVCEGIYAAWKMQTRNEWMCDHAGLVLAMWDGTTGGTANCIEYAREIGKPIINLYEKFKEKL